MKTRLKHWLPVLFGVLHMLASAAVAQTQAMGPLKVHPENPRWFARPDGQALWLTGSHTWAAFQERGVAGETPDFDFERYLDFLEEHGHNFIRLWTWEHAQWMQFVSKDVVVRYEPQAYLRTGPGVALDGKPKFDLTQFNDGFFSRLRERVQEAQNRGFYVSVMLFQGFSTQKSGVADGGNQWHGHPFNKSNNINGIDGNPSGDDTGREIHTGEVAEVQQIQEAYVRRVIDTLNDLDCVLWEIGNELHAGSVAWQYRMIDLIRAYETTKPKQHLIGMTGAPIDYPELMASNADWISPKGRQWLRDPPAADGKKVIVIDTDHCAPAEHEPRWVWHGFTRGHHFLVMDYYMDVRAGTPKEPLPEWEDARDAMGVARRLSEGLDLARMTPQPKLASSGFCLADPGRAYVVYHESDNQLTVQAARGTYRVRWVHPITGKALRETLEDVDQTPLSLSLPRAEGAVLVITAGER